MAEAKASENEAEASDDEQMLGPDPVSGCGPARCRFQIRALK